MMRTRLKVMKRRAFTLIELVMVIVVLGIVSMIATDIISSMYRGYIQTKIVNDLEQKTETLINQISKRLTYRVKETMIARESGTNTFLAMNSDEINSTSFDMVEWIGYDYESFLGEYNPTKGFSEPGWSGFIDLDHANTANASRTLLSPGSNLNIAERTIGALSDTAVSLVDTTKNQPALIFKCAKGDANMSKYGWDSTVTNLADLEYTLSVTALNSNTFNIAAAQLDVNRSICEQYYLAWSAYALVPEAGMPADDFNLTLKYNYQPWHGESYADNTTSSRVLAEHVSTFRVMQVGETLRVKVCIQDGNITGEPVGFCKEKAIF